MKLRSQLLLLVTGAAILFLSSIFAYFAILSPLDAMQREVGAFQEMNRATASLQVEADQLVLKSFGTQVPQFQGAVVRFQTAQEAMKALVLLPQANDTLADAVKATINLGRLSQGSLEQVSTGVEDLKAVATEAGASFTSSDWASLFRAFSPETGKRNDIGVYSLTTLVSQLAALNDTLTVTRQVLEKKDNEINVELVKIKDASSLAGLGVILLAVIVALLLSFLLAQSITKALHTLGATVAKVGTGDLRVRLASGRKDELGALGRDIDGFLETLTAAFRRIQAASAENLEVKDQLVQSVSNATSSALEIEANSSSILAQLRKADERIQASEADLNGVVELLAAFLVRLGTQGNSVSEASRSVGELAQGVARISQLSDENRQAVEALLSESDRGREVFDRSFAKVAEINDSVAAIQDLVGAIADIASQTNILALNAAIEAAHAGEAGKGFAVVSDEIGKLAAASAASSAQIAVTIQEVVGKIREAGATREETLGAFDAIGTQIGLVSQRGRSIYSEAAQMNQGTHRIRDVMDSLSSGSEDTTREANRIGDVTTKLGDALGQVGRISHEVVSNIGEITSGLAEISRTVGEVQTQADRLGRVGTALDEAVNTFQTEEDSAEELEEAESV